MQVQRQSTGAAIRLSAEIAGGGEGKIYSIHNAPDLVAKVYHQSSSELARKLAVMYANPPEDSDGEGGHVSIAWVRDVLVRRGRVVGFLMPRVTEGFPLHTFYTPRSRRDRCPLFNYQYLHRTACNLATAVSRLHSRGYVVGDVNESNILVSPTALVTLVDTDSFQVSDGDRIYPCPVGKPEFTPPELQGKTLRHVRRSPEHDRFGLAVLIFQLLMEGTHPFAGVYLKSGDPPPIENRIAAGHFAYSQDPSIPYRPTPIAPPITLLHPELQRLFARCFQSGHYNPSLRPDAQAWVRALRQAEAELRTCSTNPQHRYGSHLPTCPWCDRTQKLGGRDPFPRTAQEAGRLQRQPPPKPRKSAKRLGIPTPVGYTIPFPQPSVTQIRRPDWNFSGLWAELNQYKYDFLGGATVISLAMAGGLYLAETPEPQPQPPEAKVEFAHLADAGTDLSLELSDRRFDHNDRITAIAVSPNGDWFASSSRDGSLKVWSFPDRVLMQSRRLSSVLQLPEDRVQVLAVSSDGETLVGANSRSLQTWQAKTLQQLNVSPSPLVPAAVSAAGERSLQVSGLSGGEVAVWDLQSWQERRRWTGNRDRVVAMSPDGKTLITGGASIGLWDVETGQQRLKIARSLPEDGVVALSPDGRLLAVSAPEDNGVLQLWDARTGGLLHRETASHISSLTFSADGETLISGDLYGAIAIWHLTHSL